MFQKETADSEDALLSEEGAGDLEDTMFQKKRVAKTEVYIGDIRRRIIKEGIRLPRYKNFWNVQVLYL